MIALPLLIVGGMRRMQAAVFKRFTAFLSQPGGSSSIPSSDVVNLCCGTTPNSCRAAFNALILAIRATNGVPFSVVQNSMPPSVYTRRDATLRLNNQRANRYAREYSD